MASVKIAAGTSIWKNNLPHASSRNSVKCVCLAMLLLSFNLAAAPKASEKELNLAKHYVLAACIVDRYPKTPLANEADAWAAALVEDGNLPAQAYLKLTKLAKTAPIPQATQNGVVMRLESCVNFVEQSDIVDKIKKAMR